MINNLLTIVEEGKLKSKNAAMVSAKAAMNANRAARLADSAAHAAKVHRSHKEYLTKLKKKNEQDIILGMLKKMDKENKLKIEHINKLLLPRNNKNITEKERENKGNVGLPSNYTELRTWLVAKKDELIRRNAERRNAETHAATAATAAARNASIAVNMAEESINFWNDLIELVKRLSTLDESPVQNNTNWEKPQEIFNKMGISLNELLDFLDRYYEVKKNSKNIRAYALWLLKPSEEKLTAARFSKNVISNGLKTVMDKKKI